jgi:hypothetical protein
MQSTDSIGRMRHVTAPPNIACFIQKMDHPPNRQYWKDAPSDSWIVSYGVVRGLLSPIFGYECANAREDGTAFVHPLFNKLYLGKLLFCLICYHTRTWNTNLLKSECASARANSSAPTCARMERHLFINYSTNEHWQNIYVILFKKTERFSRGKQLFIHRSSNYKFGSPPSRVDSGAILAQGNTEKHLVRPT